MREAPDTSWVRTECACCPGCGGPHVSRWQRFWRWFGDTFGY